MKSIQTVARKLHGRQLGMSLMEMLVAAAISVIAVSGMLILMANTLGSGTQTIELSRMTQEMRTGMQIVTRELRRANYHSGFLQCFGNIGCLSAINLLDANDNPVVVDITDWVGDVNISGTNDCVWFFYDRPQACNQANCTQAQMAALQGNVTGESVSAFRRDTNALGIGTIQMATTATSADFDITPPSTDCTTDDPDIWTDITDPNMVDITAFNVDNALTVCEDLGTAGDAQVVERLAITLTGRPVCDASVYGFDTSNDCAGAEREITEFITVRNHTTRTGAACP